VEKVQGCGAVKRGLSEDDELDVDNVQDSAESSYEEHKAEDTGSSADDEPSSSTQSGTSKTPVVKEKQTTVDQVVKSIEFILRLGLKN